VKHLSWIITVPLMIVVVVFALSNRAVAELDLWPLPFQITAPIFALVLLSVFVGFLLGAAIMWLSGRRRRREQRELRRHADSLSREVVQLSRKLAPHESARGSNDNAHAVPPGSSRPPEIARSDRS
jgi:putative membrane protein